MKESFYPRMMWQFWDRLIQFEGDLSSTAARALLKVRFSQHDLDPMHDLSTRAERRLAEVTACLLHSNRRDRVVNADEI